MSQKLCKALIKIGDKINAVDQPPEPIFETRRFSVELADISAVMEGQKKDEVHLYLKSGEYFCVQGDFLKVFHSVDVQDNTINW